MKRIMAFLFCIVLMNASLGGIAFASTESDAVDQVVNTAVAKMNTQLSQTEQALFMHDYLIKNTVLADDKKSDKDSAYDALVSEEATSSGYAQAYVKLLKACDIPAVFIYDSTTKQAWNKIFIDQKWYIVNVALDDQGDWLSRDCFLLSEAQAKAQDFNQSVTLVMEAKDGSKANLYQGFSTEGFGDVNGDGEINSADALCVLQNSVGLIELTDYECSKGDVNLDSRINSTDALLILKYAVGLINDF